MLHGKTENSNGDSYTFKEKEQGLTAVLKTPENTILKNCCVPSSQIHPYSLCRGQGCTSTMERFSTIILKQNI